jgi:hypothetical protein
VDDLLNRLEKSAGLGGGLFKGFGNYLKNVSNYNVRKLEKANALPKEITNAKVDRNIARAGTAGVGMLGGAAYGGYKAFEGTQQQPMDTTLYEQNQFTQNNLQPKIASEMMDRLEKSAGSEDIPQLNHHSLLSAEGAMATAPMGAILGGLKNASKFGERGALKGGLGVLRGAAVGGVLGAIPGMEVGGAIGSLLDANELTKSRRLQERQAIKDAIKEELREQMGKTAETDLLERLEKTAGIFGDIVKATGIGAGRAEKKFNEFASPQGFLQHEPTMGAQDWQLQANNLKNQSERAGLERDVARKNLVGPGLVTGGIAALAGSIGLSVHEMQQLHQEALAELQAEQAQGVQAQGVQGDDYMKEANELLERLEKTASLKEVQATDEDLFARLEKTANPFDEKEKKDEGEEEQKAPQQSKEDSEPKQSQAPKQEQPAQQAQPEPQAQTAQPEPTPEPTPAPQQQQVPLAAQQPLPEQAPDPRLLILQQILADQQQGAAPTPVEPPVQEVPQEVAAPAPQDPHLELQQLLAQQQAADPTPVAASSMAGYGALETGDASQESPRQGAGSVSNAPAGVDKTASLFESLEKTAAGIPGLGSVVNAVKPKATNLAIKGAQKAGDFTKQIGGGDFKAGLKRIGTGSALVGGGAIAGASAQASHDSNMSKAAAEETPAEQKSIADKSEKEWIDFMHKVEKEDGVKAEEKPENQSKTASEDDDMLNGLFKEAAAAIMDMHFPEVRQHVDPINRITFN